MLNAIHYVILMVVFGPNDLSKEHYIDVNTMTNHVPVCTGKPCSSSNVIPYRYLPLYVHIDCSCDNKLTKSHNGMATQCMYVQTFTSLHYLTKSVFQCVCFCTDTCIS